MEKQRMTALTDITIEGVGSYQSILSLKINTAANEHGTFLCRLRLEEDEIFVNEKDRTGDSVVVKDNKGEILFCGICTNSHTAKMSAYAELEMVAKGKTIETDRKARSRTFQDASKTLQGMLRIAMLLKGGKDFHRRHGTLGKRTNPKGKGIRSGCRKQFFEKKQGNKELPSIEKSLIGQEWRENEENKLCILYYFKRDNVCNRNIQKLYSKNDWSSRFFWYKFFI